MCRKHFTKMLKEFPFRIRFAGEMGVDTGCLSGLILSILEITSIQPIGRGLS